MAEGIVRVHMVRTLPESLPAVVRGIRSAVSLHAHVRIVIFLCLGEYDLVVVSFAPHDKGRVLGDEWQPGIIGIREIPVFPWKPDQTAEDIFESLGRSQNLCLVFAYLNPLAAIEHSLRLERQVAIEIAADTAVLGLYGIPELLLVAPWFDPTNIQQICTGIYRKFSEVATAFDLKYPLLMRTMTFVLLGGDALDILDLIPEEEIDGRAAPGGSEIYDPGLSLRLGVSSSFRYHRDIEGITGKIFGSRRVSFYSSPGQQDFTVDIAATGTREGLVEDLLRILTLRARASSKILGTSTTLVFSQRRHGPTGEDGFDESFSSFPGLRRPVATLSTEACQRIERTLGETGRRIIRTVFNFNDIISNPSLGASVLDMSRGVASLAERADLHSRQLLEEAASATLAASKNFGITARDREEELNQWMMPIHSAVDQRTIASHAAVSPVESGARHLLGGIGRLLLAVESIPHSLFRAVPGRDYSFWWGYALSGVRHTHFYHEVQVIDVPPEELWRPEDWFVVIHESMHAIIAYEILRGGNNYAAFSDFVKPLTGWKRELALESAVDILTFNCGPAWNSPLYFKAIWGYLSRCLRTESSPDWNEQKFSMLVLRNWNVWLVNHLVDRKIGLKQLLSTRFEEKLGAFWDQMLLEYEEWGLGEISSRIKKVKLLKILIKEREFYSESLRMMMLVWEQRLFSKKELVRREELYEKQIMLAIGTELWFRDSPAPELEIPPELLAWKIRELVMSKPPLVIDNRYVDIVELREVAIRLLLGSYWDIYRKARQRYQEILPGWASNVL